MNRLLIKEMIKMNKMRLIWEIGHNYKFSNIELPASFNGMIRRVLVMAALLFSGMVHASDYSPDPYWQGTLGPLTIRSRSPAQSLRLAPIPRSPYGLPEGQIELQINSAAASIFIEDEGRFLLDYHFTDSRLAVNMGFAQGWSAELSLNDRRVVNAHLDQLTEEFHDLFGISQNGRLEVDTNGTSLSIPEYGINLGTELKGEFSQTVGLSIHKVLVDKSVNWPATAVNFNLSYETLGDGMIEQGSFDYGVQFSIADKRASGYAYGNISYTQFGSDDALGIPLADHQLSGMIGYEFKVSANRAFIMQYLFSQGVVENLGALDDVSHEIHLGYKWRTRSLLWELGLVENIVNFDNSPDVAFTFGMTYKIDQT